MIISRISGGLGNQMFQYAAAKSLALKNNDELKINTSLLEKMPHRIDAPHYAYRKYELEDFAITAPRATTSEITFWHRPYFWGFFRLAFWSIGRRIFRNPGKEKDEHTFDPSLFNLKGNVTLDGYWQSPRYFEMIADVLRKEFTPRHPMSLEAQRFEKEIKSKKNPLVVHVRRGDYLHFPQYIITNKDYFERGMSEILQQEDIDHIFVFSDDLEWCKENLVFLKPVTFVAMLPGRKDFEDIVLMSLGHHFVISNSSFSWWGAWLSSFTGKKVIVPKKWIGENERADMIPAEWKRI